MDEVYSVQLLQFQEVLFSRLVDLVETLVLRVRGNGVRPMVNQREKSYGLLPWPLPNVHSWAMMQRKRWDDELRINVMRHDSMKPGIVPGNTIAIGFGMGNTGTTKGQGNIQIQNGVELG